MITTSKKEMTLRLLLVGIVCLAVAAFIYFVPEEDTRKVASLNNQGNKSATSLQKSSSSFDNKETSAMSTPTSRIKPAPPSTNASTTQKSIKTVESSTSEQRTTTRAEPTTTVPPATSSSSTPSSATTDSATSVATSASTSGPSAEAWAALRNCESGGDYQIISSNGLYHGAYQFNIDTWKGVARDAGRDDLVSVKPNEASEADQDAMALKLYEQRGKNPWPHCGKFL